MANLTTSQVRIFLSFINAEIIKLIAFSSINEHRRHVSINEPNEITQSNVGTQIFDCKLSSTC